jgi:hypothetical protein
MNAAVRIVYAVFAGVLVAALRVLALAGLDRALLSLLVRGAHWPAQALLTDAGPHRLRGRLTGGLMR